MEIVFKSADEILAELIETKWIMDPFLPPGGSMMLYGRQGVGKSSLALQLAAALAQGRDWIGMPTRTRGTTAFLELDMPRAELRFLLQRANKQLFHNGTREAIHFPTFWNHDIQTYDFDVLRDEDCDALNEAMAAMKPTLLVVDTINEAYHRRDKRTGGEEIRQAIRRLRQSVEVSEGGTVYLQHKRKRQQGATGEDPDAFLGAVELESVATSSLEFQRSTDEGEAEQRFALIVRKSRVKAAGFARLDLGRDANGFFFPIWGATTALACWPYCVPEGQRPESNDRETVLRCLEDIVGLEHEALKKAVQRATTLPWTET